MQGLIPFSRPDLGPLEYKFMNSALESNHLQGSGPFVHQVEKKLQEIHGENSQVLATSSCSDALEMSCNLLNLKPDDEVIVPSYTFSSTANAVLAGGGKVMFADVSSDNFCITPQEIEDVRTKKTKAVITVNYAGCGLELDSLKNYCLNQNLILIEDNAHGLAGQTSTQNLGTFGSLSTLSFHATKNITCGEGGALVVNEESLKERAYILRDKGTNRRQFLLGAADKYTWHGFGSSYGMSDLNASILMAQLERLDEIQISRSRVWQTYYSKLADWGIKNGFRMPLASQEFTAHIFWMLAPNKNNRDLFLKHMSARSVQATFHYVPLHSSPMGKNLGNFHCPNSKALGETLVRLPLSSNLKLEEIETVIEATSSFKSA